jgi:hypothetical protein
VLVEQVNLAMAEVLELEVEHIQNLLRCQDYLPVAQYFIM